MTRRAGRKPPRNLAAYWQMEAANVLLVPGLALAVGRPTTTADIIALGLAAAATAIFLVVGALYWRGVDRRVKGLGDEALHQALSIADRLERPGVILSAAALAATIGAVAADGWSRSTIAAAILTLLAALEFVNYYRKQLQYFDNMADLKRLLSTGRLKRAHMARDLADYRASDRK